MHHDPSTAATPQSNLANVCRLKSKSQSRGALINTIIGPSAPSVVLRFIAVRQPVLFEMKIPFLLTIHYSFMAGGRQPLALGAFPNLHSRDLCGESSRSSP